MKIKNNRLFYDVIECTGNTGIMAIIQHFARAHELNRFVLRQLFQVTTAWTRRHNRLCIFSYALEVVGMILMVLALIGLLNKGMDMNKLLTSIFATTGFVVGIIGFIGAKKHELPSFKLDLDFDPDYYPALARFVTFLKFAKSIGLEGDMYAQLPGDSVENARNEVDDYLDNNIRGVIARRIEHKKYSGESEDQSPSQEWEEIDDEKSELKKTAKVFAESGFWYKNWRKRWNEIEDEVKTSYEQELQTLPVEDGDRESSTGSSSKLVIPALPTVVPAVC